MGVKTAMAVQYIELHLQGELCARKRVNNCIFVGFEVFRLGVGVPVFSGNRSLFGFMCLVDVGVFAAVVIEPRAKFPR